METKSDASLSLMVMPMMMMAMNPQTIPMPPMVPVTPTAMMMSAKVSMAVTNLDYVALFEIPVETDGFSEHA